MPRRKQSPIGERMVAPWGQFVWHADCTPFTDQDYRNVGLEPPTPEQIQDYLTNNVARYEAPDKPAQH